VAQSVRLAILSPYRPAALSMRRTVTMPSMQRRFGRPPNSTCLATAATARAGPGDLQQRIDSRPQDENYLWGHGPPTAWHKALRPRRTPSASGRPLLPHRSRGRRSCLRRAAPAGASSNCAAGIGVGDTHLRTFGGLFYDFQASGDFVLAQLDPDFVVQTRQVSGAPTWQDASVNNAIATRMGKTQVAVCLAPARLNVGGENIELCDGKSLSTLEGVDIWRRGNVYTITDQVAIPCAP
jgi:hypothetical protein